MVELYLFHQQPSNTLDYFCVDIDPPGHLANDENDLKECVSDILDVYGNLSMVKKVRVTNSGRSYHVYGYLNKPMKGSSAIRFLSKTLQYNVRGKYSINSRRGGKVKINLDWLSTFEDTDGSIHLTGEIKTFKTKRTTTDALRIYPKMKRTWLGIESLINALIN